MNEKTTLSINIDKNVKDAFNKYCNKKGLKPSTYLRIIIFEKLKEELETAELTNEVINNYLGLNDGVKGE